MGCGALLGCGHGLVDQRRDLPVDALKVVLPERSGPRYLLHELRQAVAVGAELLHLSGRAVGLRVAFVVAVEADHAALQQPRTAACAGAGDHRARGLVDGEEVGAVHGDARHAEPGGAVHVAVDGHGVVARGGLGVGVVLHHEDGRQVPHGGQVEALQEVAGVGGAVADEADRHAAVLLELGRQRRAAHQRRARAENAVGAHHAQVQVGDVHGAALATAGAGGAAVELGEHAFDVDPLGDAVAVPAVGARDVVVLPEVHHDAGRGGFLARVEMNEPRKVAGGELHVDPLLEFPDRLHGPVGLEQLLPAERNGVGAHRSSRGLSSRNRPCSAA